jgi:S1-C subfamily serine protease
MAIAPHQSIVAIFAATEANQPNGFLGTGFFCTDSHVLVTANHVVARWAGPFLIAVLRETIETYPATVVASDPAVDLALLRVSGYAPPQSFQLGEDSEIAFNVPVLSFEYGTTLTAGRNVELSPATRMGNVTRRLRLPHLGQAGDRILEISFPALLGASGSPLFNSQTFKVWGVVVANRAHHLIPAQVEQMHRPDGLLEEEVKYLLPQALAVNVEHLRALIERSGQAP